MYFRMQGRSLTRDADIEEQGTIRVFATRSAHLTADIVIEACAKREPPKPRNKMKPEETERNDLNLEYRLESAADRRGLVVLQEPVKMVGRCGASFSTTSHHFHCSSQNQRE